MEWKCNGVHFIFLLLLLVQVLLLFLLFHFIFHVIVYFIFTTVAFARFVFCCSCCWCCCWCCCCSVDLFFCTERGEWPPTAPHRGALQLSPLSNHVRQYLLPTRCMYWILLAVIWCLCVLYFAIIVQAVWVQFSLQQSYIQIRMYDAFLFRVLGEPWMLCLVLAREKAPPSWAAGSSVFLRLVLQAIKGNSCYLCRMRYCYDGDWGWLHCFFFLVAVRHYVFGSFCCLFRIYRILCKRLQCICFLFFSFLFFSLLLFFEWWKLILWWHCF